jgi:ABC-type antimicrobial peptide transport system permease subunit
MAYITIDDYDHYFKDKPPIRLMVIQTTQTDIPYIQNVEANIMALFKAKKWTVRSAGIVDVTTARAQVNNVIYVLIGTALLIAAVGGLGLANTLELNIMERTREIGILRSLGAKSYVIRLMVISESFTICVISTIIAAILSNPFGALMSDLIGQSLLAKHLEYPFTVEGLLIWITIIGTLGLFASLAPAQHAINLTVRDTLAYE